jgi:hypothetical protein
MNPAIGNLSEKLESLSADQIAEVEQFVAFLRQRGHDHMTSQTAATFSNPAFEAVWNNVEDAAYDAL